MRWLVLVLWVWGIFVVAGFAKAEPPATAAEPGKSFRDCPDCPEMVVLPPGHFMMGTESAESKREGVGYGNAKWERPRHSVTVGAAFAIGKYHVTRVEYDRFARATSRADAECPGWRPPDFVQTDRDPVVCVSWDDAQAYVAWLSLTTGKAYRPPSWTFRTSGVSWR